MKRYKILLVVLVLVLGVLAVGALVIHHLLTRTTLGLIIAGDSVSSSTLVRNLSSDDRDLVMTSLDVLAARKDATAQAQARKLLTSSDDYLWFNAALYLGAIGDQQAVPYLIKGLKHPASMSYPDVVRYLSAITGQSFAMDQARWIAWWQQTNPGSGFSFVYASLQRQAATIQTGVNIAINRVDDPTHVSYSGSPIVLIGIRVKPGANAAAAQRSLATAILGQFAYIQRDGTALDADGAVPALIDWEPDTINTPTLANMLRTGLGPVPFTQRTNVQTYLLKTGLYTLDLSNVTDPSLRAQLQAAATSQPTP